MPPSLQWNRARASEYIYACMCKLSTFTSFWGPVSLCDLCHLGHACEHKGWDLTGSVTSSVLMTNTWKLLVWFTATDGCKLEADESRVREEEAQIQWWDESHGITDKVSAEREQCCRGELIKGIKKKKMYVVYSPEVIVVYQSLSSLIQDFSLNLSNKN